MIKLFHVVITTILFLKCNYSPSRKALPLLYLVWKFWYIDTFFLESLKYWLICPDYTCLVCLGFLSINQPLKTFINVIKSIFPSKVMVGTMPHIKIKRSKIHREISNSVSFSFIAMFLLHIKSSRLRATNSKKAFER